MTRSVVYGPSVVLDAGGNKWTNLADGVASSDAATVGQIGGGTSSTGHILLADGHATPFAFTDLLQMDDGSDFMWSE